MPESWISHSKLWPLCHHYTTQVFHLPNWFPGFTALCDAHVMWEHLPCYAFETSWQTHTSQSNRISHTWLNGFPKPSRSPVYNPRPEWFLHSDPPFIFVHLSVLRHGDPKALSSRGDTEPCRICSSLQTSSSSLSFDDSLIPLGPDLKAVLDLAEPSGPGSPFRSQDTLTFKP